MGNVVDYRELAIDELKKLKQYYAAEKIIKSRITELDACLKSIGGKTRGASTKDGGGNETENKWVNIISNISDEEERLKRVTCAIKRVDLALSAVSDEEAKFLRWAYVEGAGIDNFAQTEHMGTRIVYRLRKRALINFARAFFGAVVT